MDRILIVDDDREFREALLGRIGGRHSVICADSVAAFREAFQPGAFELIVLDMRLETDRDGLDLLEEIMGSDPYQLVIVVTKYVDTETHIAAIEGGAQLYLNKDEFPIPFIAQMIDVILRQGHLRRQVASLEKRLAEVDSPDMVIASGELRELHAKIVQVAEDGEVTALIRGESGTGKELVARNIHRLSPRRKDGPFVAVSIAGLNKSTIHSELFGHEKGAFTGAAAQHKGYLEEAQGGTLFLDEIGDLDLETQVKLLRVLETRAVQRLGAVREIPVDFQLVTATNRDLGAMIERGEFRRDLYYRLQAFEIRVPPLRDHRQDIPQLAEHFLAAMIKAGRTTASGFHRRVMELFMRCEWPGNVRELRNAVEYSAIQARAHGEPLILLGHLPASLTGGASAVVEPEISDFHRHLARAEIEFCARVLADLSRRPGKAELAQRLGYNDRFVFQRRLRKALALYPEAEREFPEVVKLFA